MKRLAFLVALLLAAAGAPVAAQNSLSSFETGALSIETAAGATHDFTVEIAATADQRAQGLMFRDRMAADAGMLFLFEGAQVRAMWMKNTLIPLDMLFIDGEGKIVRIEERTVPHSERAISSGGPVTAVLELNAGTASRLVIKPGDRVRHPAFE
ncbi:MAG: DUF192 domain-containing protein [Kiloniellaceae bacterium]